MDKPKIKVMGIVNVTPDSFYPPSRQGDTAAAVDYCLRLREEGADILDIGGQSTRPYASLISEEEEFNRVIPVIEKLKSSSDAPVSIDTFYPKVARAAVQAGACFINDITALAYPGMIELAIETKCQVCLMHMQNNPSTMQLNPHYPDGVVAEVERFWQTKIDAALQKGLQKEQIVLDPGIGFGKTVEDNIALIKNLREFRKLGFPLLLGVSRKSFLSKILKSPNSDLLSTTVAVNTMAILAGVEILRVHDVKPHRQVVDLMERINASQSLAL